MPQRTVQEAYSNDHAKSRAILGCLTLEAQVFQLDKVWLFNAAHMVILRIALSVPLATSFSLNQRAFASNWEAGNPTLVEQADKKGLFVKFFQCFLRSGDPIEIAHSPISRAHTLKFQDHSPDKDPLVARRDQGDRKQIEPWQGS
jgi:hypothetical protein